MILPIRADFPLPGFPALTVLVCLICFAVFMKQTSDWNDFEHSIERYCDGNRARIDEIVLQRVDELRNAQGCGHAMYEIHSSGNAAEEIETIVNALKPLTGFNRDDSIDYTRQILLDELRLYRTYVPDNPNHKFAYNTASWNPLHMLTSSFAHGDWGHIIFNLIFFFAFATTIEAIAGHLNFAIYILVISLIIGVTDSAASTLADQHHWTLGLSGVVAGMMGMFAYLLPRGRIRVYYFFIIIFGSIAVPAWVLVLWYIGGDIYQLFTYDEHGGINVLAHVTGGVAGYFYGFFFFRKARLRAAEAQHSLDHSKLAPGR